MRSDSGAGQGDDATDVTPYLAVLDEVADFTSGSDMPDVVRAKLCKARAFALRNGTTEEQVTALELLRQALTLDAGAGVKKEIDRLARVVKKAAAAAAGAAGDDNTGSTGTDGAEGSGDMAGDTVADGTGEAAASSDPAAVASVTVTKTTRKSTTRKPQRAKQQRKKRLPPKNNRLAPRALAARAEICNALRFLFSARPPPPIQETTR